MGVDARSTAGCNSIGVDGRSNKAGLCICAVRISPCGDD